MLQRSVLLAWLVIGFLFVQLTVAGADGDPRARFMMGVAAVALLVGTAISWPRVLATSSGSYTAWGWITLLALVLGGLGQVDVLDPSVQPLFAGLVVLSGLTLQRVQHVFVTLLCSGFLAYALFMQVGALTGPAVLPLVIVLVVAASVAVAGQRLESLARRDARRVEELEAERSAYVRLYDVAATLGGSSVLDEALPQLIGTLCTYMEARVGMVYLIDSAEQTIVPLSPIWVAGTPIEIVDEDDLAPTPLSSEGLVPRVARSHRPLRMSVARSRADRHSVLGELGIDQAVAAPLVVDGETVGVVVIGDAESGEFTARQLEELAELSGPAALVLSQLGRHEEASQLANRLREVAQMKTDFVSVVSHELRTPLTSILGSLETLTRPEIGDGDGLVGELAETAKRQAGRLHRLIEDLLMMAKLDRDALAMPEEACRVRDVVDEVVKTVGSDLVNVDVPRHLAVNAASDRLYQVLANLVENALKYGDGSPVDVLAEPWGPGVRIRVADHGPGIPEADRDRVFERFLQLERADTRTRGGSGLGLAIVKEIVGRLGASISVSETPGGGATFDVVFAERSQAANPVEPRKQEALV